MPEHHLPTLLCYTYRSVKLKINKALAPAKITLEQFTMLDTIHKNPDLLVGELCALLHIDRTTFPRNMRRLLNLNWVQQLAGHDSRSKMFALTPKGIKKLNQATAIIEGVVANISVTLGTPAYQNSCNLLAECLVWATVDKR